jgi:hypothetical protein
MDRPFGHENKVPDCWPDLFAARSPAPPWFAVRAGLSDRPFRGMGQARRGCRVGHWDPTMGQAFCRCFCRWADGLTVAGRTTDRWPDLFARPRPLRETSSRDRAGGGVGGATDGANRRAWLGWDGSVAGRGSSAGSYVRRRRYRCAGRGESSSRGSGVGRWWR